MPSHLCGDQHLAVVVQHGIEALRDGPFAFTSPALVNTIYGRWWRPKDEQAGTDPVATTTLPWTGDYRDGFGNRITMLAYANPEDLQDERQRADGYGLVRFDRSNRRITFECWPRFGERQFAGWPITVRSEDNDGRTPKAWLPECVFEGVTDPVVQVVAEADGEVLYTIRVRGDRFQPPVFAAAGAFTLRVGADRPDGATVAGLEPSADRRAAGVRRVRLASPRV